MPRPQRFYIKNFGCRATQADGAALANQFSERGWQTAASATLADVVIVNTCTVTAQADQDARQTIRRIHRENASAKILVTGCYAQREPDKLRQLPGVEWVIGNSHKTAIADVVAPAGGLVQLENAHVDYHAQVPADGILVGDILQKQPFLSAPIVDAGPDRTRPNLKIQDGCHNRCTFCVIPYVRGNSRSAQPDDVIAQVRQLAEAHPEVVLTGINLGRWGRELPERLRLPWLLRRLLAETPIRKIRLSSIEPMDWSDDLIALMASEPRICKHVHMPLQSGSDDTLKAMHRRYRTRHYRDRVQRIRELMPHASIGADVMVGFPGEDDEQFEQTADFVVEQPLTYLHVFTYSARPGTPAAEHPGQVPMPLRKERNRVLREIVAAKNLDFRRSLTGRTFEAVTLDQTSASGRLAVTDNYLRVHIEGNETAPGQLVPCRITAATQDQTTARRAEPNVGARHAAPQRKPGHRAQEPNQPPQQKSAARK